MFNIIFQSYLYSHTLSIDILTLSNLLSQLHAICIIWKNTKHFFYYFQEDEEQSNISLSKLLINGLPDGGCDCVAFTEDSNTMVIHIAGTLHVLQVDLEAGATPVQTINLEKRKCNHCDCLSTSPN